MRAAGGALVLVGFYLFTLGANAPVRAQDHEDRFVVDFDVKCHAEPDLGKKSGKGIEIARTYLSHRETEEGGITWYHFSDVTSPQTPACWVPGPSTIAVTPTDLLAAWLAMFDHLLAASDVRFEQYVELDNRLSERDRLDSYERPLAKSDLIKFRMLQLLEKAIAGKDGDDETIDSQPFRKSWMLSRSGIVENDFGHWYVRAKPYWDIYRRNSAASWADDLAWFASQHTPATDECYSDCVLSYHIIEGPFQYWIRRPRGAHIAEAIKQAALSAKLAAEMACYDHEPGQPITSDVSPVPKPLVQRIRASLARVADPGKAQIFQHLDEAERRCAQ